MVEGILIFVGITSYISLATLFANIHGEGSYVLPKLVILYISVGWIIFPFWIVYKFWEWLLVSLPRQIKEWSRKKK